MGRLRGSRTLWSGLALVALVGNVIASAFCCAPALSRKAEIIDPILGAIPLCTSGLAALDKDGKKPTGQKQHCPVCLAAANKALAASVLDLSLAAPGVVATSAIQSEPPAIEERLRLGGLGSRAPPLPA
jgi:hypothetical protein